MFTGNKNTDTKTAVHWNSHPLRNSLERNTLLIMFASPLFFSIPSRIIASWDSPRQSSRGAKLETSGFSQLVVLFTAEIF